MENTKLQKRHSSAAHPQDCGSKKRRTTESDAIASTHSNENQEHQTLDTPTLEYDLHDLSSDEGFAGEREVSRKEADNPQSQMSSTSSKQRLGAEENGRPAVSDSQETVVLSAVEDDLEYEGDSTSSNNNTMLDDSWQSHSPRKLWKNTSVVGDADQIKDILPGADVNLVFNTLAQHRADPDRLNIAMATVLERGAVSEVPDRTETEKSPLQNVSRSDDADTGSKNRSSDSGTGTNMLEDVGHEGAGQSAKKAENPSADDIFNMAIQLNTEFPDADPSAIYEFLEKSVVKENRLQSVRDNLRLLQGHKAQPSPKAPAMTPKLSLSKDDSISNDPLLRNDPVFRDMRTISKMFPEKDQNEIYALVEAHYYKQDRVQAVIEELLISERDSQEGSLEVELDTSRTESVSDTQAATHQKSAGKLTLTASENQRQDDVDHLRDIFPDCDPNHIFERLEAHADNAEGVKAVAMELFQNKEYPRLKDVVEKQTKAARKRRLQSMKFTLQEVLAKFPDPLTTFMAHDKEMREIYRDHVAAQLKHDFPDFKSHYMQGVTATFKHHLLPIVKMVEGVRHEIIARGRTSNKMRKEPKDEPLVYPDEPDEYFFYELWFTLNERKVKEYFDGKAERRKAKVEEARASSELYDCHCCFEEEFLFTEMAACADGHLFCRLCIARSAEAAFGEGKTKFPCLTGCCPHDIPLSVLRQVLPAAMFSKVLRKLQEEEVRQAGIADLVDCPFCSFATIMADPEDRVFRCLNPECLKDSCRFCQEPNHVPLKCEEVEKQNETDMRTFIEKRVTEAMLRKCHHCGKRFVKDVGCNKMTCVCGATSCYVCRATDIDYSHFNGNKCNEGDMNKLHTQEMERAAKEAKAEFLRDHPEAADMKLTHDPLQNLAYTANNVNYDDYDGSGSGDGSGDDSGGESDSDMDSDVEIRYHGELFY